MIKELHKKELYDIVWNDFCILMMMMINPLPDDKILDWSKLKQIAADIVL